MSSSAASEGAESPLSTIPVICGPTASGKSAVAMWLAGRREIEIISADSRQIYRGFDVGTAKPTAEDRARVRHHCMDVAEPTERYSAADWSALAHQAIAGALSRGRTPVVVGGTGFYIAALFKPLWAQPELDRSRRARVQATLDSMSNLELRRWCVALDPARSHLGRAQLLRAIEVALLTGSRLSELHRANARTSTYRAGYLLVDPGPDLQARIATRAATMLEHGWSEEVRGLVRTVPAAAPAWRASGYDTMRLHVAGELDLAEALERIIIDTRQYAKRQRTWFRNQLDSSTVRRISPVAVGWQEEAERWMHDVEAGMRSAERAN